MSTPENKNEENRRGRFKPGQSGNPGGRPKGAGLVREMAQGHTEEAINTLLKLMRDAKTPAAARVAAANAILDRGWGKPSQPVGGAEDLPPIKRAAELSEAELLAIAIGGRSG